MTGHKHEPKRLTASEVFTIGEDTPQDVRDRLDSYFAAFVAPTTIDGKHYCFNCGEEINAFRAFVGLGVAYEWGLAHGEAFCSGCKWPARGHHSIGDDITLHNLFLAYHPEHVARTGAA